jgi:hypothetical protein
MWGWKMQFKSLILNKNDYFPLLSLKINKFTDLKIWQRKKGLN